MKVGRIKIVGKQVLVAGHSIGELCNCQELNAKKKFCLLKMKYLMGSGIWQILTRPVSDICILIRTSGCTRPPKQQVGLTIF